MNLTAKFERMLDIYCSITGARKSGKVVDTCGFCEKVFTENREAVTAVPCGCGKSVWAHVHIAVNASVASPCIYIVRTRVEAMLAAELLRQMRGLDDVGLYLGWNQEECRRISDRNLTFDKCLRGDSKNACRRCKGRSRCIYHRSLEALQLPVVVTTREAMLVLWEKGLRFGDHSIICDEELQTFSEERFKVDEIRDIDTVLNASSDQNVASLVRHIFPTFNPWSLSAPDSLVHHMRANADRISGATRKIISYLRNAQLDSKIEQLIFRFLHFIRTAAECNAAYAYRFDGTEMHVKKNRIDLGTFTSYRKLIVLNATAELSLVRLSGGARIWRCSGLDRYRNEGKVRLYVIPANPTKSRVERNTAAGRELLANYSAQILQSDDPMILLASNREDGGLASGLETELATEYAAMVFRLSRGLLRGTNIAKMCTVAFMPAAGFFTTLTDCALHAALEQGLDFPWSEVVDIMGYPRMDRGRFTNPLLQSIYMKKTISEFYQGLYRTCIRDGKDVAVIVPIPDADWITALWELTPFEIMAIHGCDSRKQRLFWGVNAVLGISPGAQIGKRVVAAMLGFTGSEAWKRNKKAIMELLGKYVVSKGQFLERKG